MREIEFRGKRKFDNTWIYGGYMKTARTNKIQIGGTSRFCTVYPETLGQYTGLKDKNGTKIFEGDIVKVYGESYTEKWEDIGVVEYFNGAFGVSYENRQHFLPFNNMSMYVRCCEVIGNIYDNPELVEIKQNENN